MKSPLSISFLCHQVFRLMLILLGGFLGNQTGTDIVSMDKAYQLLVDEAFENVTKTIEKTYGAIVIHKYLFQLFM